RVGSGSGRYERTVGGARKSALRALTAALVLLALAAAFAVPALRSERAPVHPAVLVSSDEPTAERQQPAKVDLSSIAVAPGYRLEVDSLGYDLPTAIAIIPEPFAGDLAPVYFVAE